MEFFLELFFDVYLELMMLVVPEKKAGNMVYRKVAAVVAGIAILAMLALFIWGGVLVFEKGNMWGLIPLIGSIVLSLVQIFAGFALQKGDDD